MADVFVSYVHEDRAEVRKLVDALKRIGWSVWWDPQVVPGEHYDRVIERELDAAKCVIVVWSALSLRSDNVRNEAIVGRQRGCLVQVTLESASWPSTFAGWQAVDLSGWTGELGHRRFRELCGGIRRLTGAPSALDLLKKCLAVDQRVLLAMNDQRNALLDAGKKGSLEELVGDPANPTFFRAVLKVLLAAAAEAGDAHVQVCCLVAPGHAALTLLDAGLRGGSALIWKQERPKSYPPNFVCKGVLGQPEQLELSLKEERTVGDLLARTRKQLPRNTLHRST